MKSITKKTLATLAVVGTVAAVAVLFCAKSTSDIGSANNRFLESNPAKPETPRDVLQSFS